MRPGPAVSRTTVGKRGATTYAVPVLVVVMSWLFLGEVSGWLTLLGGLLGLSGVGGADAREGAGSGSGGGGSRAAAQADVSVDPAR
ncbi:EamA family transporter [Streptomyces decoyicus]